MRIFSCLAVNIVSLGEHIGVVEVSGQVVAISDGSRCLLSVRSRDLIR